MADAFERFNDAEHNRQDCPECENDGPWVECGLCSERVGELLNDHLLALAAFRAAVSTPVEPFGYWVEQRHADPVLLRTPAYIPEPNELRTVTPLYAALAAPATADDARPSNGALVEVPNEGAIFTVRVDALHCPDELNTLQFQTRTHLKTGEGANPLLVWSAIHEAVAHENDEFDKRHRATPAEQDRSTSEGEGV